MSTKLLVSNLSRSTSEADLVKLFNRIGLVLSASISVSEQTGVPTPAGFVFMTEAGAQEAARVLTGTWLHERQILVKVVDDLAANSVNPAG